MKPIIFLPELVPGLLSGAITQTRRLMKSQPEFLPTHMYISEPAWCWIGPAGYQWFAYESHDFQFDKAISIHCPYGVPGDHLWVREMWQPIHHRTRTDETYIRYAADEGLKSIKHNLGMDVPTRWRPAIFMPRWMSRIELEILAIQPQRVQAITEADAIASGVQRNWMGDDCPAEYANEWIDYRAGEDGFAVDSACESYSTLWNKLHAPWKLSRRRDCYESYPWSEADIPPWHRAPQAALQDGARCHAYPNPWVWAITFRRVT